MSRSKKKLDVSIISECGNIYVEGRTFDAEFRYPFWLLKVNQNVLLPGFRRDHHKLIYINGKRCGDAYYCPGGIPLHSYRVYSDGIFGDIATKWRALSGLGCPRSSRGYYQIRIHSKVYIVLVRRTTDNYLRCIVTRKDTEEYIGDFLFDSKIEKVYPRLAVRGRERAFSIIIGYIMDCLVYTTVSYKLERRIEVQY